MMQTTRIRSAATHSVYGIDFTSSPSRNKPLTVAVCELRDTRLSVAAVGGLTSFGEFEDFLRNGTEWTAGLDFPFGQPRALVTNIGWPDSWSDYVRLVGQMQRSEFVDLMRKYQNGRPDGDKRHFREVDRKSGACSPMQLDYVPVAKMFFEGAPRLLASECDVIPFQSCPASGRKIVEAYPSLVARNCVGKTSYKTDDSKKQNAEQRQARSKIADTVAPRPCTNATFEILYGLSVILPDDVRSKCVEDASGDCLDAVLCAVQAAWAYRNRQSGFGISPSFDRLEGWIVDPVLLAGAIPIKLPLSSLR
jgi:hypothetical protein